MPCFSFGENDIYDQAPNPKGSLLRNIQERLRKICGFASPIFQGRGIFQYSFGLLPQRRPINTVGKYSETCINRPLGYMVVQSRVHM